MITKQEFIEKYHNLRRANDGQWFSVADKVDGVPVKITALGTYIQKLETPTFKEEGPIDANLERVNAFLERVISWN